ncbi:MAG: glycosyltransferase [Planctomycetota bacterium]|nr:glycosyltransferase [Planctomycetota bacterium]
MRILHISTRLIVGGSQENTILSCMGQARARHEVHLAFGPIFGPEGSMLPDIEAFNHSLRAATNHSTITPITTHLVPDLVRPIDPFKDLRAYRQLRALIRRIDPDVVHTHSSKAGILGRAAAWAQGGRQGRPRVVHTIHGPPFHRYESALRNRLYITLERAAARRCHAIVSVADAMTEQFRAAGIGAPHQFVTVRSGMDVGAFAAPPAPGESRDEVRRSLNLDPDHIVIGTVARLAELKGHDDILDALEDDLRADPRLRLLWVGDGYWTERLTARLLRSELRSRVVMTGLVPPARVPVMLRAMDMLVHASYREGLPRVVPQALLTGLPVVAYDVDGTREACIDALRDPHRGTGRLAPAGDVAALRDAIRWTIADPARARAAAQRGRDLCQHLFSLSAMIEGLDRVYRAAPDTTPHAPLTTLPAR